MIKIIYQTRCDSTLLPFLNDVCFQIVADMRKFLMSKDSRFGIGPIFVFIQLFSHLFGTFTMTRLWNQASISQNFLVFYNWVKQTLVHKYRYQHKRLRQNVIYQNFPCLRCLPVSTGDGRFIEQSEPHFSEPSRKICYVKNWSYFTLGESRRASFHQHFVCVTLWKREKYKLTRRLNGLNMAGLNVFGQIVWINFGELAKKSLRPKVAFWMELDLKKIFNIRNQGQTGSPAVICMFPIIAYKYKQGTYLSDQDWNKP